MQFNQVQFRAVAFVLAEAIFRKTSAEVAHNRVARDFCDHARRRDAQAEAIAVDDRRLGERKGKNGEPVDEDVIRPQAQRGDGGAHRLVRRAQDIDRIDLDRIDNSDRPRNRGVRRQFVINLFATLGEKLFRIVQPAVLEFFRQDYRGRDHWAGQRASSGFIDAGDRGDTERAQSAFMPETTATIHSFVP
jgi:hypothetical protein